MFPVPVAGAVIYGADAARLSAFYARLNGLAVVHADDEYVLLRSSTFELVILVTAESRAAADSATRSPIPRTKTAIKPVFYVPDLAAARVAARELGGALKSVDDEWRFQDEHRLRRIRSGGKHLSAPPTGGIGHRLRTRRGCDASFGNFEAASNVLGPSQGCDVETSHMRPARRCDVVREPHPRRRSRAISRRRYRSRRRHGHRSTRAQPARPGARHGARHRGSVSFNIRFAPGTFDSATTGASVQLDDRSRHDDRRWSGLWHGCRLRRRTRCVLRNGHRVVEGEWVELRFRHHGLQLCAHSALGRDLSSRRHRRRDSTLVSRPIRRAAQLPRGRVREAGGRAVSITTDHMPNFPGPATVR